MFSTSLFPSRRGFLEGMGDQGAISPYFCFHWQRLRGCCLSRNFKSWYKPSSVTLENRAFTMGHVITLREEAPWLGTYLHNIPSQPLSHNTTPHRLLFYRVPLENDLKYSFRIKCNTHTWRAELHMYGMKAPDQRGRVLQFCAKLFFQVIPAPTI